MKRNIFISLIVAIILIIFLTSVIASGTIDVKDYIKDKFSSIFSFYLSSLEDLDSYEKEFIDLLEKLPGKEQEYYAKEVYKNGFSLELLKNVKEGKTIQAPTSKPALPSFPKQKEESTENLPTIINRIKPSVVIIFTYDDKGEFLKLGSGFFISQNGDIITNYHVLKGANSAEIKASNGKTYPIGYIVADNEQSDIIRLSVNIPSQYVSPLSLNKTIPEVGERIIVYGSPLGLEKTVSDGIVSAIRDISDIGKVIQITAPISPGSSGSPVLNMKGEVVGIATFQFIEGQNLNFAIPSERIANLNLIEEEKTITTDKLFDQENKEKKDSDYAYEAYDKALYFIGKREYEKALPYLEIAIKTDISSLKAWAYYSIGYCYDELGAYTEVIEALKQVIRIEPNFASAHHNLGVVYSELGDYTDAIEAYKQAIRINPDYVSACYGLGVNYAKLGFYKDAIEAFKQAIRITPDYVYAHYGLGLNYLIIGDKSSALNEYKILKELDINLANVLFDLIYK
jgi:Tfp pilus assembly protein PilF